MRKLKHLRLSPLIGVLIATLSSPAVMSASSEKTSSTSPTYSTQSGSGTNLRTIAGCTGHATQDFIDTADPDLRRLAPRECRIVGTNQPTFSWFQPYDRDISKPWTLTVRNVGSTAETRYSSTTPRMLIKLPLPAGTYEWKVAYSTKVGAVNISQYRRFAVDSLSAASSIPDSDQVAATVAVRQRPRVLPVGSTFSGIAAIAQAGEYAPAYAQMITFADSSLATALPAEPALLVQSDFPSKSEYVSYLSGIGSQALAEHSRIRYLAYAWRFTGNTTYADAALAHLVNLAGWAPNGVTGQLTQSQANRQIYLALAEGADLLWDRLSVTQQGVIATSLRDRLAQVLTSLAALDYAPYQTMHVTAAEYAIQALLLAAGMPGFPESSDWLKQMWDIYVTTLSTFGNEDGGSDGSVAYAWFDMYDLPGSLATARVIAGANLTSMPYVRNAGSYLLAMTAPNVQQINAFGDGIENDTQYANYTFNSYRLYAAITRSPEQAWYWRQRPANYQNRQLIDPMHFMMLGLDSTAIATKTPTRNHWVFDDVGISAFHSNVSQSDRSSLFFRSSEFGSHVHSHADQNSFSFVSRGKPLLISGGYYPYYLSPHHAMAGRATRYKNAITFDGGIGQAEPTAVPIKPGAPILSFAATGKLINNYESAAVSVVTGDATAAYRGYDATTRKWSSLLSNAVRSAAYFRTERVAVIYDWLTSGTPRYWELNYNAIKPFAQSGSSQVAVNDTAQACIDHYGIDATAAQTTGFDITPENGAPNQYQLRMRAKVASTQAAIVTVIREDCRTVQVNVTMSGTAANVTVNTENVKFDKRTFSVLQH